MNKPKYVGKRVALAVDPGLKTGLSAYHFEDSKLPEVEELSWPEFPFRVERVALQYGADLAIVVESFTITVQTAKKTQAPWSLEGIGVCRHMAAKYGCELVIQAPASAKHFSSDDRLHQLGWWVPGKGHGNDASRHLLLYAATRGWWSEAIVL